MIYAKGSVYHAEKLPVEVAKEERREMGSMRGFFVRKVTDEAISAVRARYLSSEILTNSEYIRILNTKLQEQELMELSLLLKTDVMWLSYHSITDAFEYYHWQVGKLMRALGYGLVGDRTWERIEGQPEAWERQFFFDLGDLAIHLDDDEGDEEDKLSDEEKHRLEVFWQAGELAIGENMPTLVAQRCAFHIATYYRFPGWDSEQISKS